MDLKSVALRLLVGLAVAFWVMNLLAVAVFAVPDRYDGIESVFMSLLVLAGGLLPVAFFAYLFREHLPAFSTPRGAGVENSRRHAARPAEKPAIVEPLSDRELDVLTLIERGRLNKEIAHELSVSIATVKTHTNNINRKLGAKTRSQAVAIARELDLI
jgi:DNA-binding NarL/FixJ family response regulator